jgi:hypothetical protein
MKKRPIPDDFKVSPRIVELAEQNGWANPHSELDAFRDHHLAHGSRMADWEAAFRTWLRNAKRFSRNSQQPQADGQLSDRTLKILRRGL